MIRKMGYPIRRMIIPMMIDPGCDRMTLTAIVRRKSTKKPGRIG
jgi:hypothetical protein